MDFTFFGDTHGHFQELLYSLRALPPQTHAYQLGDFGFGFPPLTDNIDLGISSLVYDPLLAVPLPDNLRIIRGNHDCPTTAAGHPNYLGDFGVDTKGVGYISGAMSIDKSIRTPGLDWWADEELSMRELMEAVQEIAAKKPRIVISHSAPYSFEYHLEKWPKPSRTNQAMDELLKEFAPELWVCGHHHVNEIKRIGKTLFCCVDSDKAMSLVLPSGRPVGFSDIMFL